MTTGFDKQMAENIEINKKNGTGWQEAEDNTLLISMNWPFLKKLEWLEDAQKLGSLFKTARRGASQHHQKTVINE